MKTQFKYSLLAAIAGSIAFASLAQADTNALSFSGGVVQILPPSEFTIAWEFTLNTTVTVDSLGIYDVNNSATYTSSNSDPGDGLQTSHDVGIYTYGAGTLLASTTVTTTDPETADFAYQSLSTPLVLDPGTYVIAATSSDVDAWIHQATSVTTAPEVTYVAAAYASGSSLTYPTVFNPVSDYNSYFGPNFRFTDGSVSAPEPSTYGLLALGLGALLLGLWRKKQSAV